MSELQIITEKKLIIEFFGSIKEFQDYLLYILKPGEALVVQDGKLFKYKFSKNLSLPEKDV